MSKEGREDIYLGFKSEQTDSFMIRGWNFTKDMYNIEIYNITKCKSKFIQAKREEMETNFNLL